MYIYIHTLHILILSEGKIEDQGACGGLMSITANLVVEHEWTSSRVTYISAVMGGIYEGNLAHHDILLATLTFFAWP